ncbi:MAG: hypothetical protein KIT73_20890, partial [Burkholderiales bacterium]|nr:hypothetical protein [Burkholderiales bacterium]
NSFQHRPYLNRFAQERKLDITAVVKVPTVPIGLYSRKHRSVDEIQPGARVALPNDPTNQARALVMAEKFGWIRLKPGIDPIKVSERDVAENPKKIRLIALDPALMPRSLDDTDYSFVNGNYAIASGLKLADAVKLEENFHDRYILVAAVRTADKDKPWVRDLVAAYRSPAFEKVIAERFKGFIRPDYATAVDAPLDVARVN